MASIPDIYHSMEYGPAPEGAGPANEWLQAHGRRFGLFIDGKWTAAEGEAFETLNPANGKSIARRSERAHV